MQISVFNEKFRTSFTDAQHETIAGIVLEKFGDMPLIGTKIQIDEYTFEVLETTNKKITRLKVTGAKASFYGIFTRKFRRCVADIFSSFFFMHRNSNHRHHKNRHTKIIA